MSKDDPNKELRKQIREIQTKLASVEKECYATPAAKSVRPAISEAKNALHAIAFREELERL